MHESLFNNNKYNQYITQDQCFSSLCCFKLSLLVNSLVHISHFQWFSSHFFFLFKEIISCSIFLLPQFPFFCVFTSTSVSSLSSPVGLHAISLSESSSKLISLRLYSSSQNLLRLAMTDWCQDIHVVAEYGSANFSVFQTCFHK